ncbi:MAG: PEP/pyruvate-binding domain-containing protein, partial [Acidimicrobiia bacterium]
MDFSDVSDGDRLFAVRSSANVEDGGDTSYAGQFASVLNVAGEADVASAVHQVLDSAAVEGVASYRHHQGDDRAIEMSVIIQEMVKPVVSGVAFSKNPMTGLSETLVECVEGSGDRLQAEGVTPHRWVYRWGDFVEVPDVAVLPDDVVANMVDDVTAMASEFGAPVDAEWVYDGDDVWWVQVRQITGLDDITIYSRRIAKEVLPGMIKPLVWSINVPMVNRAWLDLLEEAVGDLGLEVEDLARAFGYRAYFNMTAFGEVFAALGMPRESLELLLGLPTGTDQPTFKPSSATFAKTPSMVGMGLRRLGYGSHVDSSLPELERIYQGFADKDLAGLDDEALLADIEELRRIGVEAARLNVVTPLLANVFDSLLRRVLTSSGVDPMSVAPSGKGVAYDPNPHLDDIAARLGTLDPDERSAIAEGGYGALSGELKEAFDEFLDRFGHFSDSGNDFSVAPWSE